MLSKETKRLGNEVKKELSALRAKAEQKKDKKALKFYRELASTLD